MSRRHRADRWLVEHGLARDAEDAARKILAGEVWNGDERVRSAGVLLADDVVLEVRLRRRYVSRGGDKLAGALDSFARSPDTGRIEVRDRVCIDVGCATGGFTDCLLQHGAQRVYAVDVGYGQLAWSLRNDPRVGVFERTNVRALDPAALDPPPDLLTADVSFTSLRALLPTFVRLIGGRGEMLLMVKPQFELARADVRDGVVRDPALHARAVALVEQAAAGLGIDVLGCAQSPLRGPKGNREFFVALRVGAQLKSTG